MNFFDILKILFFTKKKDDIEKSNIEPFLPFLVNRWYSFYGKVQCIFINETLNRFASLHDNKEDMLKLYLNFIPKVQFKKINYIKKTKKEDQKEKEVIFKRDFLSKREIDLYVDILYQQTN